MSLVRKYDKTLRRRVALRAVWLPGTEVRVGDIMLLKNGALVSMGSLEDEHIDIRVSSIGEAQSLNLQSTGVSRSLIQNGANVTLAGLDARAEAELKLRFKQENSYFLRTPVLSGEGLEGAMNMARKIAKIPSWDHLKNYVVHKVWRASDFVFLGNLEGSSEISFKGSGEQVRNIITNGISSGLSVNGGHSINLEVMGKSGPIVMQVFRVKRNGEIF